MRVEVRISSWRKIGNSDNSSFFLLVVVAHSLIAIDGHVVEANEMVNRQSVVR